jgi:hypothetical protein
MKVALTLPPVLLCIAVRALACICVVPETPCEFHWSHHGSPTFVGEAASEATVSDVVDWGGHAQQVTVQKVTFRVEEPFEDTPDKLTTVYGGGTTCDFHFKVGVRYLVYGWRGKDGKIRTDICTRTAPLSAAMEDVKFLRSLPTRVGGDINGVVRFVSPRGQIGTVAGTVTASGKDGDHKARVAESGKYELNGLAAGDYRLTFTPDYDSTEDVQFKVRIPVNGSCAATGVRLGNATVTGTVVGAAGAPVSGADVFLFYALDGEYRPEVALRTRTDANGRFIFDRVEAAKFILSVQYAPSQMIFYPGTRDSSGAEVIEVLDGRLLSGLTVRVPR